MNIEINKIGQISEGTHHGRFITVEAELCLLGFEIIVSESKDMKAPVIVEWADTFEELNTWFRDNAPNVVW
ncbi:hypothetical protein ACFSJ3_06380 [Corallincola platygyrae]|uniref:Uncharacterized protein n=1 Tax=Corallincola platygyrae TaxID=1193278 RepID=A0ABW4XLB1_9GAMM